MHRGMTRAGLAAVLTLVAACGGDEASAIPAAGRAEILGPYQVEPYRAFDRAAIEPLERACQTGDAGMEPMIRPPLQPVLADARGEGRIILLYEAADGSYAECTGKLQPDGSVQLEGGGSGSSDLALQPFELGPSAGSVVESGSDSWSAVNGTIGSEIGGVVIELEDGTRITASVGNGRYAAWWPGSIGNRRTLAYDRAGNLVTP